MFGRNNIKGVLVMVVAALFVMASANQAFTFSAGSGTPFTYMGKITAVDHANRTLTVQAGPNDALTFNLDGSGAVMKCSMSVSFGDLGIGDLVTVSYFEGGNGPYIASQIDFALNRC